MFLCQLFCDFIFNYGFYVFKSLLLLKYFTVFITTPQCFYLALPHIYHMRLQEKLRWDTSILAISFSGSSLFEKCSSKFFLVGKSMQT